MWKLALIIVALIETAAWLLVRNVPTIFDRNASQVIYDEVLANATNNPLSLNPSNAFIRTKRGRAEFIVSQTLNERESNSLVKIVDEVARRHTDRKVTLRIGETRR